jgi:hypothetical protein
MRATLGTPLTFQCIHIQHYNSMIRTLSHARHTADLPMPTALHIHIQHYNSMIRAFVSNCNNEFCRKAKGARCAEVAGAVALESINKIHCYHFLQPLQTHFNHISTVLYFSNKRHHHSPTLRSRKVRPPHLTTWKLGLGHACSHKRARGRRRAEASAEASPRKTVCVLGVSFKVTGPSP